MNLFLFWKHSILLGTDSNCTKQTLDLNRSLLGAHWKILLKLSQESVQMSRWASVPTSDEYQCLGEYLCQCLGEYLCKCLGEYLCQCLGMCLCQCLGECLCKCLGEYLCQCLSECLCKCTAAPRYYPRHLHLVWPIVMPYWVRLSDLSLTVVFSVSAESASDSRRFGTEHTWCDITEMFIWKWGFKFDWNVLKFFFFVFESVFFLRLWIVFVISHTKHLTRYSRICSEPAMKCRISTSLLSYLHLYTMLFTDSSKHIRSSNAIWSMT